MFDINYRLELRKAIASLYKTFEPYPYTDKFLHWLAQDEIIEKLEQYFFDNLDESYAEKLATTVDILNCVFKE